MFSTRVQILANLKNFILWFLISLIFNKAVFDRLLSDGFYNFITENVYYNWYPLILIRTFIVFFFLFYYS